MPVDHELGIVEPFASLADFLGRMRELGEPLPHVFPASDDGAGPGLSFEEQMNHRRISFDSCGADVCCVGGPEGNSIESVTGGMAAHWLIRWRAAAPTQGADPTRGQKQEPGA